MLKRITYAQLAELIQKMDADQLASDVTVAIATNDDDFEPEYFPVEFRIADDDGVLDEGHPILFLNENAEFQRDTRTGEQIAHDLGLEG